MTRAATKSRRERRDCGVSEGGDCGGSRFWDIFTESQTMVAI